MFERLAIAASLFFSLLVLLLVLAGRAEPPELATFDLRYNGVLSPK